MQVLREHQLLADELEYLATSPAVGLGCTLWWLLAALFHEGPCWAYSEQSELTLYAFTAGVVQEDLPCH